MQSERSQLWKRLLILQGYSLKVGTEGISCYTPDGRILIDVPLDMIGDLKEHYLDWIVWEDVAKRIDMGLFEYAHTVALGILPKFSSFSMEYHGLSGKWLVAIQDRNLYHAWGNDGDRALDGAVRPIVECLEAWKARNSQRPLTEREAM